MTQHFDFLAIGAGSGGGLGRVLEEELGELGTRAVESLMVAGTTGDMDA